MCVAGGLLNSWKRRWCVLKDETFLWFRSRQEALKQGWLLKKGEVQQMSGPKSTRTMRSRKLYHPIYLFLFNNLLLITKRSSRSV